MIYLLDTNAVIALLRGDARFVERLRRHHPEEFAISAIVLHELFYGAFKSQRSADNLARVDALRIAVLDLDREDARVAGEIRTDLAAAGKTIGPYDVLIAGQAVARGLTLVTNNVREFNRISSLTVEDWQG